MTAELVESWVQDIVHVTGTYGFERAGERSALPRRGTTRRLEDLLQPVVYPMGSLRVLHERRLAANQRLLFHAETSAVKRWLVSSYGLRDDRP